MRWCSFTTGTAAAPARLGAGNAEGEPGGGRVLDVGAWAQPLGADSGRPGRPDRVLRRHAGAGHRTRALGASRGRRLGAQ